jgi:hypothetical protein
LLSRREREVDVTEPRGLQSADRLLAPAVTASLAVLDLPPEDQAAGKLAESYARSLDQAAAVEAQADKVLRAVSAGPDADPDLVELVSALRSKLSARSALADLGPKLTALLVELGATPKARAAMAKGKPVQTVPDPSQAGLLSLVQGVPPGA